MQVKPGFTYTIFSCYTILVSIIMIINGDAELINDDVIYVCIQRLVKTHPLM